MMTPEEAGAALAADPTFATMNEAEREAEAAALLGSFAEPSDDPLDIAMALEAAARFAVEAWRAGAGAPIADAWAGVEACRLNGPDGQPCGGNEPIAGNGRCMTCGAQRRAADTPPAEPLNLTYDPPARKPAPMAAPARPDGAILRHGVTNDPGASFIGRFKEATGVTDREAAGMLGMSRATVQAYAGGRLPEKLDAKQVATLRTDIAERLLLLADLDRDLAVAIGEID